MILELKCFEGTTIVPHGEKSKEEIAKIPDGVVIHVEYKKESRGSLPMLGLWWKWMTETAEYMAGVGCTMPLIIAPNGKYIGSRPFDKNDAHELFTAKWLGTDENGDRLSWSRDKKRPDLIIADTGQRHHALAMHEAYASERGIKLTIPIKSEYRELAERMNS